MNIAFCTTVKNRAFHLADTLSKNMAENRIAKFFVLDYGSQDNLQEIVKPYLSDRLSVYRYQTEGPFHMAHAKNMAHRCAILEGADILVTLDADNFAGPDFDQFILDNMKEPDTFLIPDHQGILKMSWEPGSGRPNRGFAGRLAVRAQDFIKLGGYNEIYSTWRGEDIDFNARMGRLGYTAKFIPPHYLQTIPHGGEVRFKEWPSARQHEHPGSWKVEGHEADTVVNYGNIGVGTVHKVGSPSQLHDLAPLPTRIFGIGLQKTATTSLHKAFQTLGYDSLHWGKGEARLIWGEMHGAGRSNTLERFYALCDLPIPLLYRQLDKAYPGSKFILTLRNEEAWLRSVERMWDPKYNPTRWAWDVWPISNRLHKALYGRTDFDPIDMMRAYRNHNASVREYFKNRPADLLVMDMEHTRNPWWLLCSWLNEPVPEEPYPIEYVTSEIAPEERTK